MSFLRKLNLQFFAEDAGTTGANQPPEGGDQPSNPPAGGEQQTETPPATPPNDPTPSPKTEVSKVDTKAIRSKAQTDMLKKLGFEDVNSLQDVLAKYKEAEDAKKTESEKQTEKLNKLENNYSTMSAENDTLKAQISAIKSGVKADVVEDVVVLAKRLVKDDVDMDAAIKQVVEKYPQFGQEAKPADQEQNKPTFTTGKHQTQQPQTSKEKWAAAFNFFNK